MVKKYDGKKELGIIVGGVVAGLMMGGSALAAYGGPQPRSSDLFKIKELKRGYQLAKAGEKADEKKGADQDKKCSDKKCSGKDKKCSDKNCSDKDKKCCGDDKKCSKDKKCCEKSCSGKDKKSDSKSCGEKSCSK